jgi:hypothetical protein
VLYDNYQPGNVIVVITGATSLPDPGMDDWFGATNRAYGRYNNDHDEGNRHNQIVFVNAEAILNEVQSTYGPQRLESQLEDMFVASVAKTSAHEMGHSFGLYHPKHRLPGYTYWDANMMRQGEVEQAGDVCFMDVTYVTNKRIGFGPGDYLTQNAHRILSDPDVLGPSQSSWVAVLKPGELTIHGDNLDNQIVVNPRWGSSWVVSVTSSYPWVFSSSVTKTFVVRTDGDPGYGELNPFDEPINSIRIYGKYGRDIIDVSSRMPARLYAYGGPGNDTIKGGAGSDFLYGNGGVDVLYGRRGDDWIYGGSETDYIFGNEDNDHLFGDQGADYLFGMAGEDFLCGSSPYGWDDARDLLHGGNDGDRDTFYVDLNLNYRTVDTYYRESDEVVHRRLPPTLLWAVSFFGLSYPFR